MGFQLGIQPQNNTWKLPIIRFVIKQAIEFEVLFCFETQASFYLYGPAGGLLEKGQNKHNMGDWITDWFLLALKQNNI